ncbi:cyclopentanone 1,2-monooxygenase, partial [Aureobasidium pullulans]
MAVQFLDALVVGAGFGGIYQLKKLRDQGLSVKAIDAASDVGGTWFWNRYPGAMSDTEAYLYRYSWDLEDLRSYPWKEHYLQGPEILAYLQHVVKLYDLRKDILLDTELEAATWDDLDDRWTVETSQGSFKVRYLVTALGLLSKVNVPDIQGIHDFGGQMYHTARWPQDATIEGKRVGVIGNGSTGIQVLTAVAKKAKHLVSFQRNPQYSVPSGNKPVSPEYRNYVNENYEEIWREAKDESMFAFGFKEVSRPTFSVSPEEREEIYEAAWRKGGGFRFMFETFGDISTDDEANKSAADFIKRKIASTVKDPEKARRLMPSQLYARRPLCDTGYYEQMSRDHVEVVSLSETPITRIVPKGIITSDGEEHELDVIILATGFDAVDGNYTRVQIKGRNGQSLKQHWEPQGPSTSLGLCVPGFPNFFMITGPCGPFSNIPPAIETHVEFISEIIENAEKSCRDHLEFSGTKSGMVKLSDGCRLARNDSVNGGEKTGPVIEATPESEEKWLELCDELSAN